MLFLFHLDVECNCCLFFPALLFLCINSDFISHVYKNEYCNFLILIWAEEIIFRAVAILIKGITEFQLF